MEVKIVSKKLIKPIVATPDSLGKYKISCMDEVNATMNVVTILYYPFNQFYTYKVIIKTLETSLSKILPRFYPFAGRYIKEHHTVDCNDAGAEFMEAEVDAYDLKQVITNLEPDYLNELLPLEIGAADEITDPVCAVKVTKFRCGGIALAASVSHRIVDACSMGIFVSAWAEEATLREGQSRTIHPDFYSPSYLPGKNFPPEDFGVRRTREGSTVVCKRLIFDAAAIATLRQRVSHLSSLQSRVTVATAFLTEILMRIDRRMRGGIPRACQVTQCVNIRERTKNPVVAKYSVGNLVALGINDLTPEETVELKYEDLVPLVIKGVREGVRNCWDILSDDKLVNRDLAAIQRYNQDDVRGFWFTDFTKFGFYDIDFGWGKPVWASLVNGSEANLIVFMNNKNNDGLEVYLLLEKDELPYLENDEQLKSVVKFQTTVPISARL